MPARRRRKPGGVDPQPDLSTRQGRQAAQKNAAQAFSDRVRNEREEQSRQARERNEALRRERRRQELTEAKDAAAARLREVRRRNLPGEVRIEAEAAYRAALDALMRDEQGLPPVEEDDAPAPSADAGGTAAEEDGEPATEPQPEDDVAEA